MTTTRTLLVVVDARDVEQRASFAVSLRWASILIDDLFFTHSLYSPYRISTWCERLRWTYALDVLNVFLLRARVLFGSARTAPSNGSLTQFSALSF